MILKIASDYEGKYFEVTTADQRFANYPKAFYGRANSNGERTVCVNLDGRKWFDQLADIASFVSKEFGDECLFKVG